MLGVTFCKIFGFLKVEVFSQDWIDPTYCLTSGTTAVVQSYVKQYVSDETYHINTNSEV